MTALIVTGSRDGVVMAADGRRKNTRGEVISDCSQKIWNFRTTDNWDLVQGWSGNPEIRTVSGAVFSFPRVAKEIWKTIVLGDIPASFHKFSDLTCEYLQLFLNCFPDPLADTIRCKTLIGFYGEGISLCCAMQFFVEKGRASVTAPDIQTILGGYSRWGSGSNTLWEKRPNFEFDAATLSEAIQEAGDYVRQCIEGNETIPDCADCGGHLHIGVVDASGFRWEEQPIQSSNER
jgi:hypothetical protein